MRHASHYVLIGLLLASSGWASTAVAAGTTLKNISYQALPGGNVELKMDFGNGPVPQPKIFTTGNPPRIAVDFADTDNASARHLNIGQGSTSGVSAVTAGGRTRVVVELMRESTYRTRVEGHSLLLTINNGAADQSVTTVATIDPSKALPSSMNGPAISNIDFRRGPNGEGRVLISFSGSGANAQMTHKGGMVLVNIDHANLPANLAQRLDTLDFATPVQSIVTKAAIGGGAHIEIAVKGDADTSGYQTSDQYVVEVSPKKTDAKTEALAKAGQEPVYTGKRATFNFQDIPVRSALQLIADESGLNLVASDSVSGGVTLRLDNVPWDQALDVILRAKSLDKRRDGNVIWIAPQAELAKYEQDIADAKLKAQDTAELVTDYVPISYGKASDIAKLLTSGSLQSTSGSGTSSSQHGFLSTRGSVSFDIRTNTLLLNDTPEKIKQLRELIAVLDKPVQQVLIESRLVVANDSFTRDLGAQLGVSGSRAIGNKSVIVGGGIPTVTGNSSEYFNNAAGTTYTTNGLNVNLPLTSAAGSIGVGIIGKNFALDLELQAAQTEGRSEVISSPRVITANQQEAVIRQGQEIGYVTYQNSASGGASTGTATVAFKDAVLELKVTPTITADNRIYLLINVTKDALAGYITVPGSGQVPTINTSSVNTSALVDNGQTVVLGGIYEINNSNTVTKVPGLGDIPGIGILFRTTSRSNTKAELLIFVTPRILSETLQ
ncbi:type IV pilus secretin PilQ [Rhodanobacter sp. A1T4]|uniref:type IV pilus secretin PilQ n=1 Tax=Rhodanobacter sp. A1T4 TaxID=2723087 RepID=UPI0016078895|nr:type IV pilus secretin PilQ [Rhodanobacter sp. A1T4]MBB6246915.1 type IV pilus assembly protein PilQ [Rhodanobacter sp. A1T4]